MLWIVIAAGLTAAQPILPGSWFSDFEWEKLVAPKGGHALNFVRVIVSPDGKPEDCKIEATSEIPALDKETCAIILKRGRFKSARWADGSGAYAVYRKDFVWADLDAFHYSRPVDVEVGISRMPKGLRAPMAFSLTFAVDAAGSKSSCEPPERMDASLASIACRQIMENYPVTPAHNAAGVSVPSVQNALVSFVTE